MKCALCGFEYDEKEAMKACSGCPMSRGKCRLQKCPNCGYEIPVEPKLLKFVKKLRRKTENGDQRSFSRDFGKTMDNSRRGEER